MSTFAVANKSFLAATNVGDHVLQRLGLKFNLADEEHVAEVFEVLSDAIGMNKVNQLGLDMSAKMDDHQASESRALFLTSLVTRSSLVFGWLKQLTIQQLSFATSLDLDRLLKSCKKLETLKMVTCNCGVADPWAIDAPESQLRCLIFEDCDFGVISLLCLPRLEHLVCSDWFYSSNPLFLGNVPCLKTLNMKKNARLDQDKLMLSTILANTPNIEHLSLGFGAERIWIMEERAQLLRGSFSKLKSLSLTGIFLGCDLLWTLRFLELAPSLETLNIQVWETRRNDKRNEIYGEKPKSITWEVPNFQHDHLKKFELFGYQRITSHFEFVRHVTRRAVCLEQIFLVDGAFPSFLTAGCEERRVNFKTKRYKYKIDHNGQNRLIRLSYTKKLKCPYCCK
ncbi:hypothetical protein ACP4OV_007162 [Aristida adscensionis]